MATSFEQLIGYLNEGDLVHERREQDILVPFGTSTFVNLEGAKRLVVMIRLQEDGEYLRVAAPMLLKAEGPHRHAVLHACMMIHWKAKYLKFEYDESDGEICAAIEIPIEDSEFTLSQFKRCLQAMVQLVEQYHPVLKTALDTGEVTFEATSQPQVSEESEGMVQLRALKRRLEQLRASGAKPVRIAAMQLEIAELEESLGMDGPPDEI